MAAQYTFNGSILPLSTNAMSFVPFVGTDIADLAARVNAHFDDLGIANIVGFDVVGSGDGQVFCANVASNTAAVQPWLGTGATTTLYMSDTLTLDELIAAHVDSNDQLLFAKNAGAPQGSKRVAAILVKTI